MPSSLNGRGASVLLLVPLLGLPNGSARLPVCIDVLKDGSEDYGRERASKTVRVLIEKNGPLFCMHTRKKQERAPTCMLSNVYTEESWGEVSLLLVMNVSQLVRGERKQKKITDVTECACPITHR